MTKRIVNIDGKKYTVTECMNCFFYDRGDDGYGDECLYPERPSDIPCCGHGIPDNCPLQKASEEGQ